MMSNYIHALANPAQGIEGDISEKQLHKRRSYYDRRLVFSGGRMDTTLVNVAADVKDLTLGPKKKGQPSLRKLITGFVRLMGGFR